MNTETLIRLLDNYPTLGEWWDGTDIIFKEEFCDIQSTSVLELILIYYENKISKLKASMLTVEDYDRYSKLAKLIFNSGPRKKDNETTTPVPF